MLPYILVAQRLLAKPLGAEDHAKDHYEDHYGSLQIMTQLDRTPLGGLSFYEYLKISVFISR